MLNMPLIS